MMVVRCAKILTVAAVGLLAAVIVLNNLQDYDTNYRYVQHVMSMDTTFPDNRLMGRAITNATLHTLAYWGLMATEGAIAGLCFWGSYCLGRAISAPAAAFHQAKGVAIAGLTLAFLFWFVGFMVIGGEWFAMWQSADWNGQQPAFRLIGCVGIVLLFVNSPEADDL